MRKATGVLMLVLAACGSAQATDYTWTGGAVTAPVDCSTVWTPSGFPTTSADTVLIDTAGASATVLNHNYYFGSLTVKTGAFSTPGWTYKLILAADNGQSGDWNMLGANTWNGYGGSKTVDVAGNIKLWQKGGGYSFTGNSHHYTNVIMRGVGKVVEDNDNTDYWRSFRVAAGASVTTGKGNGATVITRDLFVDGTITGGTWVVRAWPAEPGQCTLGPGGQFTGGSLLITAPGTGVQNVKISGGLYNNVDTTPGYINGNTRGYRTIRLNGGTVDANNFLFDYNFASYTGTRLFRDTLNTDNGSGVIADLNVRGNFSAGGTYWAGGSAMYVLRANSSTITIKGNATFDNNLWIDGGTSRWNFGGNVNFNAPFVFDNTNMKTTLVTINGTGAQNLKFSQRLKLGDLVINKAGGAATLTDNVLLTGDFRIDCGTFNPATFYVNFDGGFDNLDAAQVIDAHNADLKKVHVMSGSSTWVKLMSDLTVGDNLDIDAGSKLFLNGFTLTAEGMTYSGEGNWAVKEGGEIIGGSTIPEPATLLLLGTGALGVLGCVRRRRMS